MIAFGLGLVAGLVEGGHDVQHGEAALADRVRGAEHGQRVGLAEVLGPGRVNGALQMVVGEVGQAEVR